MASPFDDWLEKNRRPSTVATRPVAGSNTPQGTQIPEYASRWTVGQSGPSGAQSSGGGRGSNPRLEALVSASQARQASGGPANSPENTSGAGRFMRGVFNVNGLVAGAQSFALKPVAAGLNTVLDVADMGRAGVNAGIYAASGRGGTPDGRGPGVYKNTDGVLDVLKRRVGVGRDAFNRRVRFREAAGVDVLPIPGWAKGTIGFAGDVATDPLLYVGAAPAARAGQAAKATQALGAGGRQADDAVRGLSGALQSGQRQPIAQAVGELGRARWGDDIGARFGQVQNAPTGGYGAHAAQQVDAAAATLNAQRETAESIIRGLTRETGRRGTGGVTSTGLSRVKLPDGRALTPEILEQYMGFQAQFGYTTRYGVKAGGSRFLPKLGEARADIFGKAKFGVSDSMWGTGLRNAFDRHERNYNKLRNAVLRGEEDGYEKAWALADLALAQQAHHAIINESVLRQRNTIGRVAGWGKRIKAPKPQRNSELLRQLDNGTLSPGDDLAIAIRQEFDTLYDKMVEAGIDVPYRRGYMPHVLTPDGRRLVERHPEGVVNSWGVNTRATFQNARELGPGSWLDLPSGGRVQLAEGTIQEINQHIAADLGKKDFKLFQEDVLDILGGYTEQVGRQFERQSLRESAAARPGILEEMRVTPTGPRNPRTVEAIDNKVADMADAQAAVDDELVSASNTRLETLRTGELGVEPSAREVLSENEKLSRSVIGKGTRAARKAEEEAGRHAAAADVLADRASEIGEVIPVLEKAAKAAIRRRNNKWNRVIRDNESLIESLQPKRAAAVRKKDAAGIKAIDDLIESSNLAIQDAKLAKKVTTPEQTALYKARRDKVSAETKLVKLTEKESSARNRAAWELANMDEVKQFHTQTLDTLHGLKSIKVDGKTIQIRKLSDERMNAAPKDLSERISQEHGVLVERATAVNQWLNDASLENDPWAQWFYKREAQAIQHDTAALANRGKLQEIDIELTALRDVDFQERLVRELDEGFIKFNETHQMPADALKIFENERHDYMTWLGGMAQSGKWSPETVRVFQEVRDAHRAFLNFWKAWAVGSPGFVSRNIQGGLSNMYMDGVDMGNAMRFAKVYTRDYVRDPDNWQASAKQRLMRDRAVRREAREAGVPIEQFADREVALMEQAFGVSYATGGGQAAVEVKGMSTLKRRTAAPWRADNKYTGSIRNMAMHSESLMRGGHAYHVLREGGDFNTAVGRVKKFHFDYTNISSADRNIKQVIPFWMFFSRNLPLQAQMWTTAPQRINRSYVNLVRNVQYSMEPEDHEVRPDYYDKLGMFQTPYGAGSSGGSLHMGIDLPLMRLPADLASATTFPPGVGMLEQTYPHIKTPIELWMNKNSFYDSEFQDSHVERDHENGGYRFREAPWTISNPIINPIAPLIPGVDRQDDGTLTMTDRSQHVMQQLPIFQRGNALIAPTKRDAKNWEPRALSFLTGLQLRRNSPEQMAAVERAMQYQENMDQRELGRVEDALRKNPAYNAEAYRYALENGRLDP